MSSGRFQSTLPRGERLRSGTRCRICYDFNPRSHEGSDYGRIKKKPYGGISIHAPTRGATKVFVRIYQKTRISIHAPTRGATVATSRVKGCSADFNPRSHEGSDLVEIRARRCVYRFQSTLPRGERHCLRLPTPQLNVFQSTLPRGERQFYKEIKMRKPEFQSTLPRGERPEDLYLCDARKTFQSTLPRGERPCLSCLMIAGLYFNPRSHEGSDTV